MLSKSNFSCILPFITMQYIFFYNSVTILHFSFLAFFDDVVCFCFCNTNTLHFIPRLLLQLSGNAYQDIRSLYCPPLFFYFSLPLVYIIAPLRPVVKYFFEKLQNKKTGQKPCFFCFSAFWL
jgi:hypothetical protein